MPARYEALKRKFLAEGMSKAEAEEHAAKIYYSTRKEGEPALHSHQDLIQKVLR